MNRDAKANVAELVKVAATLSLQDIEALPEDERAAYWASLAHMAKADILEEADIITGLLLKGMQRDEIKKLLHLTEPTLNNRLKLLRLPAVILEGVRGGEIKASVAEKLTKLSDPQLREAIDVYRAEGTLLHRHVKELKRARREDKTQNLPDELFAPPPAIPPRERAIKALQEVLASGVTVRGARELVKEAYHRNNGAG